MAKIWTIGCMLAATLVWACGDDLGRDDDGAGAGVDDSSSDDGGGDTADGADGADDGGDGGGAVAPECNPLGGQRCSLPFPSSLYMVEDATSPTGVRLDIPERALPISAAGVPIDPAPFNQHDGFSPAAPIITAFATGVDASNLPRWTDLQASLAPDCPTVIVDMETGELVPHFAELDARGPSPDEQALYIRPAVLLEGGRRYAVAIRKNLRAPDGAELPVPAGFQAILDGTDSGHERLERIRPRYADILAALADHGVAADDLVVAWDFVTASRESMRRDMIAARDSALALLGTSMGDVTFEITRDEPSDDARFSREIEGFFDAPLLLTEGGEVTLETRLARRADGRPVATGLYRVPFDAIIPACATADAPAPMMVYGHGLLGDSDQVMSGGTRTAAAALCMVAIGTDLRGMSTRDAPNVLAALSDANRGYLIFETLIQGIVNHISLVQVARARFAGELFTDEAGRSVVDPDRVFYYGISQGGIFGGTIMAYDPFIERGVLQVGAMNYSMLLERSADWPTYQTFLQGSYPNAIDVSLLISLMQMQWDTTDPDSVADAILEFGIPGVPAKQLLMQIGVADVEVSNVASEYQVRSMGIPVLAPSVYQPWGVELATGPVENALAIFDFGLGDTIPITNEPPPDNEVHSSVRRREAAIEMMRGFYANGEIVSTCGETGCFCETGGCGPILP
ncbi:MAG TPA: hypothetical protein VKB80_29480 [Kofleriaceae bacterium]|nr:hypothetical protein [Kofleriaceae bacterium]